MKKYILTFLALLLPQIALADAASVWVGGGIWDYNVSGSIRYQSTNTVDEIDIKDDLHLQDDSDSFGYLVIEHPIPVLPNIKIVRTNLSSNGSGITTKNFTYGGKSFTLSTNVTTELVLNQTDFTLYYEVLDNIVGFDLGLTGKNISGRAKLTQGTTTSTDTFDVTLPMLYAMVSVGLPYGFTIGANGNYVSYSGSSISDFSGWLRYTSAYVIGVEAGYRSQVYKLDDLSGSYGTLKFAGPYASVFLHF